jgi:hypothetical protein
VNSDLEGAAACHGYMRYGMRLNSPLIVLDRLDDKTVNSPMLSESAKPLTNIEF